jgi:hypothetical protein
MTEEIDAGRLVAEVVSDTTGFGRDAKKKIDAEVRALKARIKAEIDTRGLVTQAKAAAKEASKAAVVRLKVQLDTKGLIGQARTAAAAAAAAATVHLKTDLDTRALVAQAKVAAKEASAAAHVTLTVDADIRRAEAEVEAFKRKTRQDPVQLPPIVPSGNKGLTEASRALKQLSVAPAIAGGVFLLGTAVVQLGGGLLAVASAAAQAVGTVAILPNLAGVAAQGVASLLIGVSGVGGALSAMSAAEKATTASTAAGGAQATATARAVEAASRARTRAAQAVKDAQQSLADAQKAADDQAISGARSVADARRALADARYDADDRARAAIESVSDAEWSLARSQESARDAQQSLTEARVAAKQRIDDLNAALKTGALNEEEAALAVEKARQNLQDVKWNVASSDLDEKEAQLAIKRAEENEARIKDANKKTAADAAKANQQGVEGSDEVTSARERVRDALHAEQEDTENLAKAQRDLARDQVESARAIELAQRAVGDAVKQNRDGEISAARAIEQAQRGIVDAKANYVDAQRAVADANKTAAAGGTKAAAAQTALAAAMDKLSPAGKRFAKFIYGLKPQWESLRSAVQESLLPPIQRGITAALPLLGTLQDKLVDSAGVAGGLGEAIGEALGEQSFRNDVGTIMDSNNRAMSSFGAAGLSVIQILRNLAVAAGPLTERFASWVKALTAGWEEEVKVGRETGKLEGWLDKAGDTAALLGGIFKNVGGALFGLGKAAAPAGRDLLNTFDKVAERWNTFANSDAGQAQMREFFAATKPVTEELGKLVVNLVEFITKAGEGGGGSLNGFLQTLNFILGALNKLMAIPGVAPVLGWVMTLAGVGGALGLTASVVLKMGSNLQKLAKVSGLQKIVDQIRGVGDAGKDSSKTISGPFTKAMKTAGGAIASAARATWGWIVAQGKAAIATAATTGKLIAQRIASAAMVVWGGLVRIATLAWTAAQWLLNIALSPIGLIVIAIVAAIGLLVLGFIYAWKHSETFRKVVTGALNGLKTAALAVFHALADAVQWVIGFVGDHWKLLLGILGGPLVAAVILIVTHWSQIKAIFWAAVGWVKTAFGKAWAGIKAIITDPLGSAKRIAEALLGVTGLRKPFNAVVAWVKGTWAKIWAGIKATVSDPIAAAKNAIALILGKTGLQKIFTDAVSGITKIWDGLKNAAKAPVKFIVQTVLNDGLIGGFNWIAGKVGAPNLDPIKLPKGFEDGGHFTGRIPGAASKKDNLLGHGPRGEGIGLATGEYIVNAEDTAKTLPLLNAINSGKVRMDNMVRSGFAEGGLFGNVRNFISSAASKGKEFGGDVLSVLKDPAGWFKRHMTGPLGKMKDLGDSPAVQVVKAVPSKIVDVVAGKAKEILSGLGGGGGGPINPGLAGALNWVKTQVGKPYLWGGVGPDGYDCSGLMGAIVNVIRGAEDPFKRLFATASMPAGLFEKGRGAFSVGWFQGNPGHTAGTLNGVNVESRGGRGVLVGPQARGADDPLFNSGVYHLKGYAKGGLFTGDAPFDLVDPRGKTPLPSVDELMQSMGITFDTGGWVAPGSTAVRNGTGEHEAMFEPAAWKGASGVLDKILTAGHGTQSVGDASATSGPTPLVGSLAVSVENKDDLPEALDEVTHRLRVISRGGVYADRTP